MATPDLEKLRKRVNSLIYAVATLAAVVVALVIALAVVGSHDGGDDDDDEAPTAAVVTGGALLTAASAAAGGLSTREGYHPPVPLYAGSGEWATKKPMPEALSDLSAVTDSDGMVYLIGGLGSDGGVRDSLTRYDPILEQYTTLAAMPQPNHRYGAAHLDGKIYVVGGYNSTAYDALPLPCMDVYDIATDAWEAAVACTAIPHSDTCAAALGGKIYVVAGYTTYYEYLATVEVYDPSVDNAAFEAAADLPEPRGDVSCVATSSHIFVAGGYYDPTGAWLPDSFHTSVFAYDPNADAWSAKAPMPVARGDKAIVALDDSRLLVIAGEQHARGEVTQVPTHSVELYSVSSDMWIQKASIPTPRFRFAAAATDGEVMAFGGHVLCTTGWDGDWDNPDCTDNALDSQEIFFDLPHPDVLIHMPLEA